MTTNLQERQIYNAAHSYHYAAQLLSRPIATGPGTFHLPILPIITCYTFSLELYLKCLTVIVGESQLKEHKYTRLFKNLDSISRASIISHFNSLQPGSPISEPDFLMHLSTIDNAFVEWRYIYESSSGAINLEFVRNAVNAIQNYILTLRPEWRPA